MRRVCVCVAICARLKAGCDEYNGVTNRLFSILNHFLFGASLSTDAGYSKTNGCDFQSLISRSTKLISKKG